MTIFMSEDELQAALMLGCKSMLDFDANIDKVRDLSTRLCLARKIRREYKYAYGHNPVNRVDYVLSDLRRLKGIKVVRKKGEI